MTSEWCCAPLTVPERPPADQSSIDGWRLVVGFRNLNAGTKADSHPLPLIEEEIVKRAKGNIFFILDSRHGFHQMPLAKSSRPLTCMSSPLGPVQWTVMPLRLKNAPGFFQPMMEKVLFSEHPELREFVSVYIDDIIIATVGDGLTEQELVDLHEKQLNIVLDIPDKKKFICGPKKGKYFWKVSNSVAVCCEMGHASRVQGSSSQSRSGSALRPFWPFVDSLAVVMGFPCYVYSIRQDTAGYGRIRQDTAGYSRIRKDTAGYGRIRQDTTGSKISACLHYETNHFAFIQRSVVFHTVLACRL